jgi:antibiotic biosynthesis monooxygenase (ABM) superfamily enzyme
MLPNTDKRYEMVAAFDQSAVVLWINSETKAALIRRGWRFAW